MRTIIRVVMAVVGVAGYFLVGSILGRLDEEAAAYSHTTRQKVFTDIWALKVLFAGELAFVAGSAVRLLGGLWERELFLLISEVLYILPAAAIVVMVYDWGGSSA